MRLRILRLCVAGLLGVLGLRILRLGVLRLRILRLRGFAMADVIDGFAEPLAYPLAHAWDEV